MKEYLFVNTKDSCLYSYFRLEKKWKDCFVVHFSTNNEESTQIYWGNTSYVKTDRAEISLFLTLLFLTSPTDEWKRLDERFIKTAPILTEKIANIKMLLANYYA